MNSKPRGKGGRGQVALKALLEDLYQQDLADLVGTTERTIGRWKNGQVRIPPMAEKFLRLLDLLRADGLELTKLAAGELEWES